METSIPSKHKNRKPNKKQFQTPGNLAISFLGHRAGYLPARAPSVVSQALRLLSAWFRMCCVVLSCLMDPKQSPGENPAEVYRGSESLLCYAPYKTAVPRPRALTPGFQILREPIYRLHSEGRAPSSLLKGAILNAQQVHGCPFLCVEIVGFLSDC